MSKKKLPKRVYGWHFSNGYLGYRDGRPIFDGAEFYSAEAKMCRQGFHFSRRAADAFYYRQGDYISRVVGTKIAAEARGAHPKLVAHRRKHIWVVRAAPACEATIRRVTDIVLRRSEKIPPSTRHAVRNYVRYGSYYSAFEELREFTNKGGRSQLALLATSFAYGNDAVSVANSLVASMPGKLAQDIFEEECRKLDPRRK